MEPQTSPPNLLAKLENLGYRGTAPRKAIADLLEQKYDGFKIEAVIEELPSVGRATVYRTIKLLLDMGAICKVASMDGTPVYSVSRIGHHHHHYVCVNCGAVEEFRAASVERMLRSIADDLPGEIVDHRIELYVACHPCPAVHGA